MYVLLNCCFILYYRAQEDHDLKLLRNQKNIKDDYSRSVISTVNFWKPIWPNFFDMVSQESFSTEGIAMMPLIFCNARNQKSIKNVIYYSVLSFLTIMLFFWPLCYITYGDQIQYMVLFNLGSGYVATVVKFAFTISIAFNIGMNFFPIFDILENINKNIQISQDRSFFGKLYTHIVSNRPLTRAIAICVLFPICLYVKGINFFVLLNGSICINFFQLILPNFILIRQCQEKQFIQHHLSIAHLRDTGATSKTDARS